MTEFKYLRSRSGSGMLSLSDVGKIVDSLRRGSLAVLPTETGYMIAALATSTKAIEQVFFTKDRPTSNVMHVACSSLEMAESVGIINQQALRVLGDLTPGPVSVVVTKTELLPDKLVTLNGTVGIRIPDHPATLQVINALSAPVTATSLNSSGSESAPLDRFDIQFLRWSPTEVIYVVEDDASIKYSCPSTLVRIVSNSVEVLRAGPISEEEIVRVAGVAHRR